MKKLLTVAAVTLMASGAAFAGTLAYGFITDDGPTLSGGVPATGQATFIRVQNFSSSTVNLTSVFSDNTGTSLFSNTGSLVPGNFFSWRPRNGQGIAPNGPSGDDLSITVNGSITIFHDGAPGDLGGNVLAISSNGARLGYLTQEQI